MPDHAQDVGLLTCLVDRLFHGFAIQGQSLVQSAPGAIPGIERGIERARRFSWERTARETWAVFEEAAGHR